MLGLLHQERAGAKGLSIAPSPENLSLENLAPETALAPAEKPSAELQPSQGTETANSDPLSTEAWISESLAKESAENASSEYELVVGRRQIATWLFLGLIVVALTATVAYLAGKASKGATPNQSSQSQTNPSTPKPAASQPQASQPPIDQIPAQAVSGSMVNGAPVDGISLPQASIMRIPAFGGQAPNTKAPMFAEPEIGKIYLQIGAVSKGMAVILAEGLRSHGFDSFVAPGPSAAVFRVLIGPLKDPQAFNRAKAEIDSIELGSFVRRYEKTANDAKPVAVALPSSPSASQ